MEKLLHIEDQFWRKNQLNKKRNEIGRFKKLNSFLSNDIQIKLYLKDFSSYFCLLKETKIYFFTIAFKYINGILN